MKKLGVLLVAVFLLSSCSVKTNNHNSVNESIASTSLETSKTETSNYSQKNPLSIDETGEIKDGNDVKYKLTVTEVKDVTSSAENELINDTNYLDYYSSGQGKQAVQISIKMENLSGEELTSAFLDDVTVKDSDGITNVGGWKNDGGDKTEFGAYITDEDGNINESRYTIQNDETKIASSTVLLATPSDQISFVFTSEMFNDEIYFELPISN